MDDREIAFEATLVRLAAPFAVCYLVGQLLFLLLFQSPVTPVSRRLLGDLFNFYSLPALLFAAACGWLVVCDASFKSAFRRGWRFIAFGCLSIAIADGLWGIYEILFRERMWSPSPADAFFLAVFPFLLTGLVLLLGPAPLTQRVRVILDSALISSAVGVLFWYFLIHRVWMQSELTALSKIVNILYPLGDISALFLSLVFLMSSPRHSTLRRTAQWLLAGILLWTIGDGLYAHDILRGKYYSGIWYDGAWAIGALCIGFGALNMLNSSQPKNAHEREDNWFLGSILTANHAMDNTAEVAMPAHTAPTAAWLEEKALPETPKLQTQRLFPILWPYLAALSALAVVTLHDYAADGSIGDSVVSAGLVLFLLVLARQTFTLIENDRLARGLRDMNEGLEAIVERRTFQLRSLHGLTRAVGSTLDAELVIDYALQHTRKVLNADATAIWLRKPHEIISGENSFSASTPGEDVPAANASAPETPSARVHRHLGIDVHPEVLEGLNRHEPQNAPDSVPVFIDEAGQQRAVVCLRAPLWWQNRQLGSIGVLRWDGEWDPTEQQLLESIGLEIGAALFNAQRFGEAVEAADRDAVTGLFNHRAITRQLAEELREATPQRPLSVIMLDLNNFKWFNDTFGHPAGDAVLRRTAQLLAAACRQGDIAARYGGDEFLAVLPDAGAAVAHAVAERLDARVRIEGFRRKGEAEPIPMALSYGIATFPSDCSNGNELLAMADANLYAAKAAQTENGARVRVHRQQPEEQFSKHSFEILDAMVTAINNQDHYTRRHSEDVTEYALLIAGEIGLSPETMRVLRVGALLHDVGKIGVPEEVLRNRDRLSPEAFEMMKRHPHLGALICAGIPGMNSIVEIVRSHHERWDGQGYPDALAEDEIPILARLLAVADAFSAMTTSRPYRAGMSWPEALDEIRAGAGTQFDPQMARAFLQATRDKFH